jgi:hypothetical protein
VLSVTPGRKPLGGPGLWTTAGAVCMILSFASDLLGYLAAKIAGGLFVWRFQN